jgi:hypothetical protein
MFRKKRKRKKMARRDYWSGEIGINVIISVDQGDLTKRLHRLDPRLDCCRKHITLVILKRLIEKIESGEVCVVEREEGEVDFSGAFTARYSKSNEKAYDRIAASEMDLKW